MAWVSGGDWRTGVLEKLREEVYRLNLELPKNGLVAWASGNVSGRDAATGLVVIKPSGVRYDALSAEDIPVVAAWMAATPLWQRYRLSGDNRLSV